MKLFIRPGKLPPNELIILAQPLIAPSVMGDQPPTASDTFG
ncbi:hypothetical protein ACQYVZ_004224 [Salmonella enterica subsp. enterica]